MTATRRYCTFILRGWVEGVKADQSTWRFRIHDVQTDTEHGFTSLEAMVAYLQTALAQATGADDAPAPPQG